MGALKTDRMGQRDDERWPLDGPRMTKMVSPDSSFSSGSSFCENITPHPSPPRLRRSTVDLSQIRSSSSFCCSPSRQKLHGLAESSKEDQTMVSGGNHVEDFVEDTLYDYISLLLQTLLFVETGLQKVVDEAQHHAGNFCGFLLNSFFGSDFLQDVCPRDSEACAPTGEVDEPPPDPPLSPARVTNTPSSNSKDEWGHFADFQDELADEKYFLPTSFPKSASLETLQEDDGYEGDGDAFSF
jgi:hypothetical protein